MIRPQLTDRPLKTSTGQIETLRAQAPRFGRPPVFPPTQQFAYCQGRTSKDWLGMEGYA